MTRVETRLWRFSARNCSKTDHLSSKTFSVLGLRERARHTSKSTYNPSKDRHGQVEEYLVLYRKDQRHANGQIRTGSHVDDERLKRPQQTNGDKPRQKAQA